LLIWMPCTLPAAASASELPKEILIPSSADRDFPTARWTRRTEVREGAHLSLIWKVFNLFNVDNLTGDSGGSISRIMNCRAWKWPGFRDARASACSSAPTSYSGHQR
jgi:hypothetical protein